MEEVFVYFSERTIRYGKRFLRSYGNEIGEGKNSLAEESMGEYKSGRAHGNISYYYYNYNFYSYYYYNYMFDSIHTLFVDFLLILLY